MKDTTLSIELVLSKKVCTRHLIQSYPPKILHTMEKRYLKGVFL
jgi:hypothetical protein